MSFGNIAVSSLEQTIQQSTAFNGFLVGTSIIGIGKLVSKISFQNQNVSKVFGYAGSTKFRRLLWVSGLINDVMSIVRHPLHRFTKRVNDPTLLKIGKCLQLSTAILASAYLLNNHKNYYTYLKVVALVYFGFKLTQNYKHLEKTEGKQV